MAQTTVNGESSAPDKARQNLIIGALGVVYGDIGTSPLYTVRQCFNEIGGLTTHAVLGVLDGVEELIAEADDLDAALRALAKLVSGPRSVFAVWEREARNLDAEQRGQIFERGVIGVMQEPARFQAVLVTLFLHRHTGNSGHDLGNLLGVETGAEGLCIGVCQLASLFRVQHGADPADDVVGLRQRHLFDERKLVVDQSAAVENQKRTLTLRQRMPEIAEPARGVVIADDGSVEIGGKKAKRFQSPSFHGSAQSASSRTGIMVLPSTRARSCWAMPVHVNRLRALCAPMRESRP